MMRFLNELSVNVMRPGARHPVMGQDGRVGRKGPTGGATGLIDAASNDGRAS